MLKAVGAKLLNSCSFTSQAPAFVSCVQDLAGRHQVMDEVVAGLDAAMPQELLQVGGRGRFRV